ncbi:MAG: hypothetical protein ACFCGT_02745 [Sandaracinaceae bacterium]
MAAPRAFGGALALVLVAAGCGPLGNEPRNRLTPFEPPTGEYRVHYLEPPWRLQEAAGNGGLLRVPNNAERFGGGDGGQGNLDLELSVEAGVPVVRAAAERTAALGRGEQIEVEPRPIVTRDLVEGVELLTRQPTPSLRFLRYAFLPTSPSRVLRMAYEGNARVDTREIDEMIRNVEVGLAP